MSIFDSIVHGLNEAIEYKKENSEIIMMEINDFTDDYFDILESRHNNEIQSERETL